MKLQVYVLILIIAISKVHSDENAALEDLTKKTKADSETVHKALKENPPSAKRLQQNSKKRKLKYFSAIAKANEKHLDEPEVRLSQNDLQDFGVSGSINIPGPVQAIESVGEAFKVIGKASVNGMKSLAGKSVQVAQKVMTAASDLAKNTVNYITGKNQPGTHDEKNKERR